MTSATVQRPLKLRSLILLRRFKKLIHNTANGLKRSNWQVKIMKNWCLLFVSYINHHQSHNKRRRSVFWQNFYHLLKKMRIKAWSWLGCWEWGLMSSVLSLRNGSISTLNRRYMLICRLASFLTKLCTIHSCTILNWRVLNSFRSSRSKLKLARLWCQSLETIN